MFWDFTLQRKQIHTLPRFTILDSKLQYFQYKILHNALHLNQNYVPKHNTSLCSFCNLEDEKVIHLLVHCSKTEYGCIYSNWALQNLHIPRTYSTFKLHSTIECSPFGKVMLSFIGLKGLRDWMGRGEIFRALSGQYKISLINYFSFFFLFKYYVYVSRSSKFVSFEALLKSTMKVNKL